MEVVVCSLRVNREGVHMHRWSKHFKTWLREAYLVKEEPPPPPPPTIQMDETCGAGTIHELTWDYHCKYGMDNLDTRPQGNTDTIGI